LGMFRFKLRRGTLTLTFEDLGVSSISKSKLTSSYHLRVGIMHLGISRGLILREDAADGCSNDAVFSENSDKLHFYVGELPTSSPSFLLDKFRLDLPGKVVL